MTIREYQKTLQGWRAVMVAACILTVTGAGVFTIARDVLLPVGTGIVKYAASHTTTQ